MERDADTTMPATASDEAPRGDTASIDPSLAASVFDAVAPHVALIEADGRIIHVNRSWRQFAIGNAMAGTSFGVGDNYLEICDRAVGPRSEGAAEVRDGIAAVLGGSLSEFSHDYPCHSDSEARWFRVTVSPLSDRPVRGAVVMHIDTTRPERDALALRSAERAARESEQRLDFALEAANIGDWSLDLLTNAAHRSLRHDQCFGYRELLPQWGYDTFLAHIVPSDRAHVDACFQAAMAGKGEFSDEFRTVWPDGSLHWLWTRGSFSFDEHGQPYRVAGIVMNITERKNVDRAAERALERLTEAQRIGRIGDWEFDFATGTVNWSDQVYEIMGRDRALGPPVGISGVQSLLDPDSIVVQDEHIAAAIETRATQTYEMTVPLPDGGMRFVQALAVPRLNERGEVSGLYGTVQDITDRKRSEAVSERLASIVSSSDDAIIGKDLDGRVTSWNRGAQKIFGYIEAEIVGRSFLVLIPEDRRDEGSYVLQQVRSGHGVEHLETVRRRKDSRLIEVSITASPIRNAAGVITGISKVVRDISDRKRLERQFLRAQRMESIGTLAGGIAHDLNNVLTPILLSLEMLRQQNPDPASLEMLDDIEQSARHGAAMVRQVLLFARGVDSPRLDVDVLHIAREIAKIARDTFLKQIEIKTIFADDLGRILGDPTQLHQVLLNLCVNARDAMPGGGTLTITADNMVLDEHHAGLNLEAKPGPYVCIRVLDTGTGIPPDKLDQVFDPFFTTKEVGKGTGLGLSSSQAIVKSHGGFIRAYTELGRGSTFAVYLPARGAADTAQSAPPPPKLPRGRGELVLVVDDEASVRHITQQTLEGFGYSALVAADGAEAIAIYAKRGEEIAVVLTDMTMPFMDGPSLIRVLRKMNPAVRIVAASGLDAREPIRGLGVTHFLAKPFAADVLLQTLREVLDAPRPS